MGTGRDGGLHGELTGMEEGAVADVLDHVVVADERLDPDPGRAFAAHVCLERGDAEHRRIHATAERVATDAGTEQHAFGHPQARVVRASGAQVRGTVRRRDGNRASPGRGHCDPRGVDATDETRHERRRNPVRVERPVRREQRLPALVGFAHDHRRVGYAIERLAERGLQERSLLLDDDDLVETGAERAQHTRVDRVGHEDVEQADAQTSERVVIETEDSERGAQLVPGVASRRDADPIVARRHIDAVQPVHPAVLACEPGPDVQHFDLGVNPELTGDVRADVRHIRGAAPLQRGQDHLALRRADLGRPDAVGDGRRHAQCRPETRPAGQCDAVQSELDDLLDRARLQDRHRQRP